MVIRSSGVVHTFINNTNSLYSIFTFRQQTNGNAFVFNNKLLLKFVNFNYC